MRSNCREEHERDETTHEGEGVREHHLEVRCGNVCVTVDYEHALDKGPRYLKKGRERDKISRPSGKTDDS